MTTRRTSDSSLSPQPTTPLKPTTAASKSATPAGAKAAKTPPAEAKSPGGASTKSASSQPASAEQAAATSPVAAPSATAKTPDVAKAEPHKHTTKPKVAPVAKRQHVTEDQRRAMIAEAAYLRAERRGFAPGGENEDWIAAEKEIGALLSAESSSVRQ